MTGQTVESQWPVIVGLLLLAAVAGSAHAATSCVPADQPGMERCVSGLPADALVLMQQRQRASNWCWAASVSMVLRRYGVQVPQEDVVRAHYGSAVNLDADPVAVSRLMNRPWRDTAGRRLVAAAAPVAGSRQLGLLAPQVIDDLDNDRPLLLGAQQHAVVLVKVEYERPIDLALAAGRGTRLVGAVILDPASDQGVRVARPGELQPEFLARVEVQADEAAMAMAAVQLHGLPRALAVADSFVPAAAPSL